MIKRTILFIGLWLAAGLASAAEAGKVIFVAGDARADARPLVLGAPVNEGELLSTGADGYVYIKTLDDGLFILRPATRARIAAYRVDHVNPANTRVKLELLSGVARTQSGKAVKLARQNFRFNTPVAAIGVRGTDFTVFTDDQTSSVAVLSGGITISGFSGACAREGSGPCEGAFSRELSASQKGQLLQIRRGQVSAQLVTGSAIAPDSVAPPRTDEPLAKAAASSVAPEPYVAPQKVAVLQEQVKPPAPPDKAPATPPVSKPEPEPELPIVGNPVPVDPTGPITPIPDEPVKPARAVVWGRFAAIAGQPAQVDLAGQMKAGAQLITQKGNYALLHDDEEFTLPQRGNVAFELKGSEAYIYSGNSTVKPVQAALENGELRFDFDKRKFATSFDLVNGAERIGMHASGSLATDGRFSVDSQFAVGNNMAVDGVLSGRNAESATYLFQGRLSGDRSVYGGTTWGKTPGQ